MQHCVAYAFAGRSVAPSALRIGRCRLPGRGRFTGGRPGRFQPGGVFCQPFAGIGLAAEDYVFYQSQQMGVDIVVEYHHLGVDYAHIHPGLPRVIEKRRVHGRAHRIVASEGERKVADAAGDLGQWQILFYPAHSLDKGQAVAVVLRDARGDGKYVGVKDYVLRGEAVGSQQLVCPLGDGGLPLQAGGLTFFVEEHHHCRSPIGADQGGPAQKLLRTFFQGDGIHDGLALAALQAGHNGVPRRRVYHQRDACNLYFAG